MTLEINSFIFLDLETTGLEHDARITEMSLIGVYAKHLIDSTSVTPRALNKLTLCLNPLRLIHCKASDITGLYNDILEDHPPFKSDTVEIINHFIQQLPQPVCLVAHNGNAFDFPILKRHIQKAGASICPQVLYVDSLLLFQQIDNKTCQSPSGEEIVNYSQDLTSNIDKITFTQNIPPELQDDDGDIILSQIADKLEAEFVVRMQKAQKINETTPKKNKTFCSSSQRHIAKISRKSLNYGANKRSYKLMDVYERLTGNKPETSHVAEADAFMLLKCAASLGIAFVNAANESAMPFSSTE